MNHLKTIFYSCYPVWLVLHIIVMTVIVSLSFARFVLWDFWVEELHSIGWPSPRQYRAFKRAAEGTIDVVDFMSQEGEQPAIIRLACDMEKVGMQRIEYRWFKSCYRRFTKNSFDFCALCQCLTRYQAPPARQHPDARANFVISWTMKAVQFELRRGPSWCAIPAMDLARWVCIEDIKQVNCGTPGPVTADDIQQVQRLRDLLPPGILVQLNLSKVTTD